jgi:predicted RNA binding protein YcfA (HicA-like mRNA interferase family)
MSLSRKQLKKYLETKGWELVRSKKHFIYKKGTNMITVPNHNKIAPHTAKGIIKEADKIAA